MYQSIALPSWPGQRRLTVALPMNPRWCETGQMLASIGPASANVTWTTANTAVGFWITAPHDCTVYKMGWQNSTAAGGNTDVAIYAADGTTLLASCGSTAGSGNSSVQYVNTTDLALTAGNRYFVAMNHDSTTANQLNGYASTNWTVETLLLAGIKVQAVGAAALPNPFVPADPAATLTVPLIFFRLANY